MAVDVYIKRPANLMPDVHIVRLAAAVSENWLRVEQRRGVNAHVHRSHHSGILRRSNAARLPLGLCAARRVADHSHGPSDKGCHGRVLE